MPCRGKLGSGGSPTNSCRSGVRMNASTCVSSRPIERSGRHASRSLCIAAWRALGVGCQSLGSVALVAMQQRRDADGPRAPCSRTRESDQDTRGTRRVRPARIPEPCVHSPMLPQTVSAKAVRRRGRVRPQYSVAWQRANKAHVRSGAPSGKGVRVGRGQRKRLSVSDLAAQGPCSAECPKLPIVPAPTEWQRCCL